MHLDLKFLIAKLLFDSNLIVTTATFFSALHRHFINKNELLIRIERASDGGPIIPTAGRAK